MSVSITPILHLQILHCYSTMIPSGQLLLEENTLLIMQKIINCEILESSSLRWRAEGNYVFDDRWNTNKDEDELLTAIYNGGILDASLYYMTADKCPQERQKKKVVKSKTNCESMNNHPLHMCQ